MCPAEGEKGGREEGVDSVNGRGISVMLVAAKDLCKLTWQAAA